jgi:hypothetical protein
LVIVLTFLVVSLVIFASVMSWAASNAKITVRNNLFNQAQGAAESATENIITYMMRDFNNQSLNPASAYQSLFPPTNGWPIQYRFSDTNGNINYAASVYEGPNNWSMLPAQFTGLGGYGQNCVVASTAAPLNQGQDLSATVSQVVWFGTIPVFQYAVFYNMDLEINPGRAFNINGRVHSNYKIWATGASSSEKLTFSSSVDAALTVSNRSSPLDPRIPIRTGYVVYPANNPVAPYATLNLPLGLDTTNNSYSAVESLLQLPPAAYALGTADAYSTNGQIYFANLADLIITNDAATGTNITVLYQNQNISGYLAKVSRDKTNVVFTTNQSVVTAYTNIYFSYVTNVTFYDYREHETVKALQIDVGKLSEWLTNTTSTGGDQYEVKNATSGNTTDKGHVINSIFVYNSLSTNSQLPAVRVVNGAKLPNISRGSYRASGLGIATAMPIYVQGDYNITTNGLDFARTLGSTTNNTLPAALLGDSITILSSNWNDAYTSGIALSSRSAVNTTINAACFQGIVPSDGTYYSGGLENFLRLLESWTDDTLTYNGSIVVMFPSIYATRHWDGGYYGVPTRSWGFDTTFTDPNKLPPLCPRVKGVARSSWAYR